MHAHLPLIALLFTTLTLATPTPLAGTDLEGTQMLPRAPDHAPPQGSINDVAVSDSGKRRQKRGAPGDTPGVGDLVSDEPTVKKKKVSKEKTGETPGETPGETKKERKKERKEMAKGKYR
ncbi:hypothetical protein L873DRAFT_1808293 [Choiromyces venosus 120613-1]|uniref:Uncharacterized protein n=1 Tax=Choiromyces venosus 120613-1 TaxID=1336337 RepID=A0A3N4JXB3_9PEZI|nr:hypothetical protein L873DRAFT_1808293 [Choiromyces venosus 120613-1]